MYKKKYKFSIENSAIGKLFNYIGYNIIRDIHYRFDSTVESNI